MNIPNPQPDPNRRIAICYERFSHSSQAGGDSLRRQSAAATSWCAQNGYHLDETLSDEGLSAFTGKNKSKGSALSQIIDRAESGHYPKGTRLIVESVDRITREEHIEALELLLRISKVGLVLVILNQGGQEWGREDQNPYALMAMIIEIERGKNESKIKSTRIGEAWSQKRLLAQSGKPMTRMCPAWLQSNGVKYSIIPERVKIVKKIFDLSKSGWGARRIAKHLNEKNISTFGRPRSGNTPIWYPSYVKKILENIAVIGHFQPRTKPRDQRSKAVGDVIENYFPAIIDPELFYLIQHRSKSRKGGRSNDKNHNLFSGKLFCLGCGGKLIFLNKGKDSSTQKQRGFYLECQNKSLHQNNCEANRIQYHKIEHILLSCLDQVEWSALLGKKQAALTIQEEIISLEEQINIAQSKRERLYQVIEESEGDTTGLSRRCDIRTTEIQNLQKKLKQIQDKRIEQESQQDEVQHFKALQKFIEINGPLTNTQRAKLKESIRNILKGIAIFKSASERLRFAVILKSGTEWILSYHESGTKSEWQNREHHDRASLIKKFGDSWLKAIEASK